MTEEKKQPKRQPFWLIYLSLLIAGIIFLGKAYSIIHINKWTAQIGIAMIFSAAALIIGNGRKAGFISVAIIWISVLIVIFL